MNAADAVLLGALLFGVVVLVLAMMTNLTQQERKLEAEIVRDVTALDRFVDIGVVLRTVVADPDGEELLEGKPLLRVIRQRTFGGIVDTKAAQPFICAPTRDPVVWHCSEEQETIILHADSDPLGQLVYGSEGGGKTVALAMWHYFRWLEHLGEGRQGGQTAPTGDRLDLVRKEMFALYRPTWFHHHVADDIIEFCDGTSIRLKSTYQQSKSGGSPIQGFNWSWAGRDEGQDQVERHEDIEQRGRSAKHGRYKQLITATAKDDYSWRNLRDRLLKAVNKKTGLKLWIKRTLLVRKSPFVSQTFFDDKAASMTEREYRRRVDAVDLPPERSLYHTWRRADEFDRPLNLRAIPPGAIDVTQLELRGEGNALTVRVGYDPGTLWDVSILLKAFRVRGQPRPWWWVVGEVNSEQSTTDVHIKDLLRVVGEKYACNMRGRDGKIAGPQIAVRADPYGDTGNDANRPDITVYKSFRNAGIMIRPAAYIPSTSAVKVARVPKEARIDMVCTLLCAANGERRLFVDVDEHGQPVAPKLVEAFETMERDEAGHAETQKKNKKDMSHWPAALGYGLWSIEKPRIEALRRAA